MAAERGIHPAMTAITDLPPEVLERIFLFLSSDIELLRSLSEVCSQFLAVVAKVPVSVHIPLKEDDLAWLRSYRVPVRSLVNCEIAAYVSDQIFSLNLSRLRVAKLVGYDYQSKKCEVTPQYWKTVCLICHKARDSLRRFDLNVDLSRGKISYRFAEILTKFQNLRSLSIHFSAHIELNQRILNTKDSQILIDTLLSNLPNLKTFNIFICPPRTLQVSSRNLQELGIFKSDAIEIRKLYLPSLRKLSLHENTVELFRKISADQESAGANLHKDLLSVIYEGCPNIRTINRVRLGPELSPWPRLERRLWTRLVNRALVRRYQLEVEHSQGCGSSHRIL